MLSCLLAGIGIMCLIMNFVVMFSFYIIIKNEAKGHILVYFK